MRVASLSLVSFCHLSLLVWWLEFSSLEVKYDIFRYGDEGTWQKHPNKYSQQKIVDPYLSSMSWTHCNRKKPSRWKNINTHTHARARTHTHTHTHRKELIFPPEKYFKTLKNNITISTAGT